MCGCGDLVSQTIVSRPGSMSGLMWSRRSGVACEGEVMESCDGKLARLESDPAKCGGEARSNGPEGQSGGLEGHDTGPDAQASGSEDLKSAKF
jgi:hypothetical protein